MKYYLNSRLIDENKIKDYWNDGGAINIWLKDKTSGNKWYQS